jgi:hypothetical protein
LALSARPMVYILTRYPAVTTAGAEDWTQTTCKTAEMFGMLALILAGAAAEARPLKGCTQPSQSANRSGVTIDFTEPPRHQAEADARGLAMALQQPTRTEHLPLCEQLCCQN